MTKKTTTTAPTYKGYPINTNNSKQACYVQVLDKLTDKLEYMLAKHSKVTQARIDLRYPADNSITPDPKHLSRFTEYFKRDLERNNPMPPEGKQRSTGGRVNHHKVDPHIIKVTEKHAKSDLPHTHVLALVNGNAKHKVYDIQRRAQRQWNNVLGLTPEQGKGLVDFCDRNGPGGYVIKRVTKKDENNKTVLDLDRQKQDPITQAAVYQASYLAKYRGKENKAKGAQLVTSTRQPKP